MEKEIGIAPKPVGENAWGDAALFQEAGIPTLMFGAPGDNFHAPQERVSLSGLLQLERIIEMSVKRFCT